MVYDSGIGDGVGRLPEFEVVKDVDVATDGLNTKLHDFWCFGAVSASGLDIAARATYLLKTSGSYRWLEKEISTCSTARKELQFLRLFYAVEVRAGVLYAGGDEIQSIRFHRLDVRIYQMDCALGHGPCLDDCPRTRAIYCTFSMHQISLARQKDKLMGVSHVVDEIVL